MGVHYGCWLYVYFPLRYLHLSLPAQPPPVLQSKYRKTAGAPLRIATVDTELAFGMRETRWLMWRSWRGVDGARLGK